MAMPLARRYTETGLEERAHFFGGVSPSAVTRSVERLAYQQTEDLSLAKEWRELEAAL